MSPTTSDRYRELLKRHDGPELRDRVRRLEDELSFGSPGTEERSFLLDELIQVRSRKTSRSDGPGPALLILPVGTSPEPLLFAVAHHEPRSVALLVPALPDGSKERLELLWNQVTEILGVPPFEEVKEYAVGDDPNDVFQTVRRLVAEDARGIDRSSILIDITGGKKSMTGGAFLAAGFLGLDATYVDFEHYDDVLRRPDPDSIRPGRLQHPEELFRLRDEVRLRERFDTQRYREAKELALDLETTARSDPVREALGYEEAKGLADDVGRVVGVAKGYELWLSGFYAGATDTLAGIEGVPVPPTLRVLAGAWPSRQDEPKQIEHALEEDAVFRDPRVPLAYFLDVLQWASDQRIRADPRGVFLRLYGTVESLASFLFEASVARRPERLELELENERSRELLEEIKNLAPEGGDWLALLKLAVVDCVRRRPPAAFKLMGGEARRFRDEELNDTGYLTGYLKKAKKGGKLPAGSEQWIHKAKKATCDCTARLTEAVLPSALASWLSDERSGKVRFFRNKVVHWLAPVPVETTVALREYLCELVREGVPRVVADWWKEQPGANAGRESAERHRLEGDGLGTLEAWAERVLAAACGDIPDDCQPLRYAEVQGLTPGHGRALASTPPRVGEAP